MKSTFSNKVIKFYNVWFIKFSLKYILNSVAVDDTIKPYYQLYMYLLQKQCMSLVCCLRLFNVRYMNVVFNFA